MTHLDTCELMNQYRLYERQSAHEVGYHREDLGNVIRYVSNAAHGSIISDFSFEPEFMEQEITSQINFFKQHNKSFEWKVYETDLPKNIGHALEHHGFIKGEPEAFMVLDLKQAPDALFEVPIGVIKVTNKQGVDDAILVQEKVWNRNFSDHKRELINLVQFDSNSMSLYVVYRDDLPVASARITFNSGSPFAGLWGGSTLPNYRNKGCYADLLKIRAHEARSKGIQYLTIDASKMSRPIVEKLGFQFVTYTTPYEYHPI